MRVLKTKDFSRWAKKAGVLDASLIKAIKELENGLFDADLGANLFKKRIAVGSKGKSSGVRTIIAYKSYDKSFFIYGYKKSKIESIDSSELEALKNIGDYLLSLTNSEINKAIFDKKLRELAYEEEKE